MVKRRKKAHPCSVWDCGNSVEVLGTECPRCKSTTLLMGSVFLLGFCSILSLPICPIGSYVGFLGMFLVVLLGMLPFSSRD